MANRTPLPMLGHIPHFKLALTTDMSEVDAQFLKTFTWLNIAALRAAACGL